MLEQFISRGAQIEALKLKMDKQVQDYEILYNDTLENNKMINKLSEYKQGIMPSNKLVLYQHFQIEEIEGTLFTRVRELEFGLIKETHYDDVRRKEDLIKREWAFTAQSLYKQVQVIPYKE